MRGKKIGNEATRYNSSGFRGFKDPSEAQSDC